uniref:Uncharacterized protein n=1 Tax=viral metagenome TaxID=1070528 RepID=A0A6M3IFV0_9ZZZZ
MPYSTVAELPDNVKSLPAHAKEIYMKAFNAAFEQYKDRGKQREALAHATAWTAVKTKYKQDENDNWVAKEAASDLSDDNKSDEITSVEPEKMKEVITYEPIEALRNTYQEIIQEAGKRNASLDAARIKKIVELCQELLSSEGEVDVKVIKKVTKEAAEVLTLIKEQPAMKIEDGQKFPSGAYVYVPDTDKPSGWQLRIWETPDLKATKKQVKIAALYLSNGGYSGKHANIAREKLSEVKRRLRSEYLNLEMDDLPKWITETETRERILNFTPLTEAKYEKRRAQVIVIKPGFNASEDRYYPAEMLKRDYKVFEGMKMYADHPTEEEDKARPERSITDWVATLKEVTCDENGVVTGIAEVIVEWLNEKLTALRDKGMLNEMGISINAVGSATKSTIDGKETLVIEKLVACRSVDFVTEPGAGGIVTFYESDRRYDVDLIELSTLREKRPDLVKSIEANVRAEITKEVKKAMENEEKITELEGQVTTLTAENTDLKTKMTEVEKAKAKAEAQATIKEAVDQAELPNAAKERIVERFKDAETADGIEEAIKSEVDYIAKLAEAGKVKGLGQTKTNPEKDKADLRESFKKLHPEWTDAQIDTAVTGR